MIVNSRISGLESETTQLCLPRRDIHAPPGIHIAARFAVEDSAGFAECVLRQNLQAVRLSLAFPDLVNAGVHRRESTFSSRLAAICSMRRFLSAGSRVEHGYALVCQDKRPASYCPVSPN